MKLLECVVDASVCVKVFIEEQDSARAIALFSDPAVTRHAPDLLLVECANVLWTKVHRGHYSVPDAAEDLRNLRLTDTVVTQTTDLLVEALALARALDISVYDACYVALAESLGVPLITADDKLAAKLAGTSHQIIMLAMI